MSFTDVQKRRLSSKLSEKHVKTREVDGATLSYVEGWHVIAEANRIFGFDAWDRVTQSTQCVWNRANQGRHHCVYTAKVRISVRAGDTIVVVREGNGTGEGVGVSAGMAHDIAIKAAETDATKRALATFGNPFGLALYDKEQAGVRRRPKRSAYTVNANGDAIPRATVVESNRSGCGPKGFLCTLRKALTNARSLNELEAVWTGNCGRLDQLRTEAPNLKNASGQHYADILLDLCEARAQALQPKGTQADCPKAFRVSATCRQTVTGKIDKAELVLSEPKRIRNKEHLKFVASQECLICGRQPAQAHHIRYAQPNAMAKKVSDEYTVPLCRTHHQQLHNASNEKEWWQTRSIDPLREASRLWSIGAGKPD